MVITMMEGSFAHVDSCFFAQRNQNSIVLCITQTDDSATNDSSRGFET